MSEECLNDTMTQPITVPQMYHEPTASVMRILQLQQRDGDTFTAQSIPQFREAIYGGQVLGQAIMAGSATVVPDRFLHSMHALFIRAGNSHKPLRLSVDRLRDGGSFSTRRVNVCQDDSVLFEALLSYQEKQPGLEHQIDCIDLPDPDDVEDELEIFQQIDHPVARFLGKTVAFRMRHIEENLYLGPPSVASPRQGLWIKSRHPLPANTPQSVHRAFLAYVSDQFQLETVLRAHKLSWRDSRLAVATLDHAMWFHRDVDVNQWLAFVQDSPSSGGGRGYARTLIYNRDGVLVASVAQEGMVRLKNTSSSHWNFYSPEDVADSADKVSEKPGS